MNISISGDSGIDNLNADDGPDWVAVFDHAYAHSLDCEYGDPVPHGRLSTSLQAVEGVGGNFAATVLIREAVASSILEELEGQFATEYELTQGGYTGTPPFDAVPGELKTRRQWVCWRYDERSGSKPAKVPIDPRTGDSADVSDAETWDTFEAAVTHLEDHPDAVDGVGFVFTETDPYVGIDLDDCVADGIIDEWAREEIARLDSYAEISPSGAGIHCIVMGSLPGSGNRRGSVEIYDRGRFFTVTGDHIAWTPTEIASQQDALEAVYEDYLAPEPAEQRMITGGGVESTGNGGGTLSDDKVLAKAKRAKNGAKFTRLWNGDISGYPSQSEADEALCCELVFWCQGDRAQVDRLFRRSKLMRPKWDEQRGNRTYGEQTIDAAMTIVDNYYNPNYGQESTVEQQADRITIDDVRAVVIEEFDEATWEATETVLSTHATLLLNQNASIGLVLVGPSGSGKTTVLRFFEDPALEDMVYRSDDVTPASFVSHDASKSDEQLEEIDLLPRLKGKTLLSRDMANWFAGDEEVISKKMAVMANVLDGDGYTRDTGTHGQRGYIGSEYRFNFVGASTPLRPGAWKVMGNVGNRLVFYEREGTTDLDTVIDDIIEGSEYQEKVARCRAMIRDYLRQIWDENGGAGSVEVERSADPEVKEVLRYLVQLVRIGRAPEYDGKLHPEGPHRIGATLWAIAQGHALLHGRRHVTMEDMEVCARIALSTMPKERQSAVRALLDTRNGGTLTASDMEAATGVSRPTALGRMELLETLGFAVCREDDDDGRKPMLVELRPEFRWPASLEFPEKS